jgi:hypothetical protein
MQAYEGYFNNGQFISIGKPVSIPSRRRVILTVFDEPIQAEVVDTHAEAWCDFLQAIRSIEDEPTLEFERVKFRENDI